MQVHPGIFEVWKGRHKDLKDCSKCDAEGTNKHPFTCSLILWAKLYTAWQIGSSGTLSWSIPEAYLNAAQAVKLSTIPPIMLVSLCSKRSRIHLGKS